MNFDELIVAMTPDMHQALKRAIEVRKWPNGERLTEEQLETCMEAVLTFDATKLHSPNARSLTNASNSSLAYPPPLELAAMRISGD